jgi:hypothetical protein
VVTWTPSYRFIRAAAFALIVYGALGVLVALSLIAIGATTFGQLAGLQNGLDGQRRSIVQSIRTVSGLVRDTADATADFRRSLDEARASADGASQLSNQAAGTFRQLAASMDLQIFGLQPLVGLAPQFNQSANQLQQLAISIGATRDALAQNGTDVQRASSDLATLQIQLDQMASTLDAPGVFGLGFDTLLPFQIAFYGTCALLIVQSVFSVIAGIVLVRLTPGIRLRTATTTAADGDGRDRARGSQPAQRYS